MGLIDSVWVISTILKMEKNTKGTLNEESTDRVKDVTSKTSNPLQSLLPYVVTAALSFSLGATLFGVNDSTKIKEGVEISSELKLRNELERWNAAIYADVVGMKNDLSTIDKMTPEEIGVACARLEIGTKNILKASDEAPVEEVGSALKAWADEMSPIIPNCSLKASDVERKEAAVRLRATEPQFINFVTVYSKYVPATAEEPAQNSQTNENN